MSKRVDKLAAGKRPICSAEHIIPNAERAISYTERAIPLRVGAVLYACPHDLKNRIPHRIFIHIVGR